MRRIHKMFAVVNEAQQLLLSQDMQFFTMPDDWAVAKDANILFIDKKDALQTAVRIVDPKFSVIEVAV